MTLQALLKIVSTKIPPDVDNKTFSFFYGEKAWQNLIGSDTVFPLMSVDFFQTMKFILQKSRFIGQKYPAAIYLCYKSELDWSPDQHEVAIAKSETAARSVLSQLMTFKDSDGNSLIDDIEFLTDATRIILRPSDDVGTSGVMLPLLITPTNHLAVCTL